MQNIARVNDSATFSWKSAGENEGWKITRIPGSSFAHEIVFDNDTARVMFYLKYGIK